MATTPIPCDPAPVRLASEDNFGVGHTIEFSGWQEAAGEVSNYLDDGLKVIAQAALYRLEAGCDDPAGPRFVGHSYVRVVLGAQACKYGKVSQPNPLRHAVLRLTQFDAAVPLFQLPDPVPLAVGGTNVLTSMAAWQRLVSRVDQVRRAYARALAVLIESYHEKLYTALPPRARHLDIREASGADPGPFV
jgi:hypothetical protein